MVWIDDGGYCALQEPPVGTTNTVTFNPSDCAVVDDQVHTLQVRMTPWWYGGSDSYRSQPVSFTFNAPPAA